MSYKVKKDKLARQRQKMFRELIDLNKTLQVLNLKVDLMMEKLKNNEL